MPFLLSDMAEMLYFFDLYKDELKICRSDSTIIPPDARQVYSKDLCNFIGEYNISNITNFNAIDDRQIIPVKNFKNIEFIVKRKYINCYIHAPTIQEEDKMILNDNTVKKFLDENLKEYFMSKLISAHPSGVSTTGFSITKLVQKNILVMEFLMENAGQSLSLYLSYYKPTNFNGLKYFKKLIGIMKFIESLKLAYSDVKMSNFLMDSKSNLRIIDYDISLQSDFDKSNPLFGIKSMLGATIGYAAPEALDFFLRQQCGKLNPGETIDPWKADVYSSGIMGLFLLGAIKDANIIKNLDKYKNDPSSHLFIINLIKNIECENSQIKAKMELLL